MPPDLDGPGRHARNKVERERGRTGAGAVEREEEVWNGRVFAWCL